MSEKQWDFRGVQLDLARQVETVEYIEGFIDLIAGWGLNTLVLYLEGRVRTAAFPFTQPEGSYTPAEMKRVVAHAGERGIDVIPAVSCLGHAEQFLQFPELEHLAELRGGRMGRFGPGMHVFCPSEPRLYEFLGEYLGEMAEIFPSPYIHVGCDEAWDMGYCELCRPRAEGEEGPSGIFAQHLNKLHEITAALGKRMIMWDDLFEHYEQALEQIPKDIVMCCWQYDYVRRPRAHFKNIQRWDALGDYARRGFDAVVAPRELAADNIATLTKYAAPRRPLGGFVTTWEHSREFLHMGYPNIAFAGKLWSDLSGLERVEAVKQEAVAAVVPEAPAAAREAVRAFMELGGPQQSTAVEGFLPEFSTVRMQERRTLDGWVRERLEAYLPEATGLGAEVVEDMVATLRGWGLQYELREIVPEIFEKALGGNTGETPVPPDAGWEACATRLGKVLGEIDAVAALRRAQWERYRPGILSTYDALNRFWDGFHENIAAFAEAARAGTLEQVGLLTLELFLADGFSSPRMSVALRYAGDADWTTVAQGGWKPMFFGKDQEYDHAAYYRVPLRMDTERAVEACRLEVWGYGGQGVRYVEVNNRAGRFVPACVREVSGRVENPAALLVDNSFWCYLGDPDTGLAVLHPEVARVSHGLTVEMGIDK